MVDNNSEYEPFDLDGQSEDKKLQELKHRLAAESRVKNLQWVMSDKRGRSFIWALLSLTGVFRISYTGTSETYFREGMRNIGVQLLADLKTYCTETYKAMEREQEHDRRNADDGSKHN